MKRRTFIQVAGLGSVTALAGYAGWYEPNQYEFSFHRLGDQELPTNGTIRFAQLSDIHLSEIGDFHERFIKGIVDQRLDFLVFSGDIIERNSQLSVLGEFLSMFPRDQQKYAILGNWEHWGGVSVEKLASVYERYNCRLLINESIVHRTGQSHLLLTGLDDMVGGIPSLEHALIGCEPRANHLLLIHSPVFVEKAHEILLGKESSDSFVPAADLRSIDIRYALAGHTHGGQVNLLGMRPFLPQGSGRYVAGWYRDIKPSLYVSRGIGTSILPVRIGSVPEIPVFEYRCTLWHAP